MNSTQPIVLMYHGITSNDAAPPRTREPGAEIYDVPVESFRLQLKHLMDTNRPDALITFDDGEMNNYTNALPVLKNLGLKGHFFVIAKSIGKKGFMGFPELRELIKEGMVIGSHGLTHEILTNLLDTQVEEELRASKKYLEKNLGIEVEEFSVPRGFCNDKIIRMAYKVGYTRVFVSDRPRQVTADCMERIAVKESWTLTRFKQALTGDVPLRERINEAVIRSAKFVLRESGYNTLRKLIINIVE